jgi:hypothetical protein
MLKKLLILLAITSQVAWAQYEKSQWDGANTPSIIDPSFVTKFKELPMSASLGKSIIDLEGYGWSASYWPSFKGSIAYRWNHPTPNNFKYKSPSRSQAMSMSKNEIAMLSPAEKYDLYLGRYDYPTREAAHAMTKPKDREWAGICHGWAPVALDYVEPSPVNVVNPDGIEVAFGASDVKALMSYYYAFYSDTEVRQVSKRCFVNFNFRDNCKGVNPGSLHVVLTNMIGIKKTGFIVDIDRYKEVWNQPVVGYKSTIMGNESVSSGERKKGIAQKVRVKTEMYYTSELSLNAPQVSRDTYVDHHTWESVYKSIFQLIGTKYYEYTLELDSQGSITGGEWISDERPDFLWTKKKDTFQGYFEKINDIYRPII